MKWIKVLDNGKRNYPKNDGNYLITKEYYDNNELKCKRTHEAEFKQGLWWIKNMPQRGSFDLQVTHWSEMPEPAED